MHHACRGLIDGATTLELDNGITRDGKVVVWHDEDIMASKCQDTSPAVGLCHPSCHSIIDKMVKQFPEDPMYPYVGKYIVNLTLSQVKTLDCGSKRQDDYRKTSPLIERHTPDVAHTQRCK